MFTGFWVIGFDFFQSDPNINSNPISFIIEHDNKSGPICSRVRYISDRIPKLIGLELLLNRARQSNRTRFKLIGSELS